MTREELTVKIDELENIKLQVIRELGRVEGNLNAYREMLRTLDEESQNGSGENGEATE